MNNKQKIKDLSSVFKKSTKKRIVSIKTYSFGRNKNRKTYQITKERYVMA